MNGLLRQPVRRLPELFRPGGEYVGGDSGQLSRVDGDSALLGTTALVLPSWTFRATPSVDSRLGQPMDVGEGGPRRVLRGVTVGAADGRLGLLRPPLEPVTEVRPRQRLGQVVPLRD